MLTHTHGQEGHSNHHSVKEDRGNDCNRSAVNHQRDVEATNNSLDRLVAQDRGPLTPRFRALIAEAIEVAETETRAEFGVGLAARMILDYGKTQPPLYSLERLEMIGTYDAFKRDAFKRRWPCSFVRLKGTLWQPRNGFGEPTGAPWQFKQYDALLIPHTWTYAGETVCALYDDRGPGDGYWHRLARVIDATTHPARCIRELLGGWLPPSSIGLRAAA
jgi:hypothetical protein